MTEDKPVFKSVGEAMIFGCYNWPAYAEIVKESPLSRMEGTNSREQLDDGPAPARRPIELGPLPRGELAMRVAATIESVVAALPTDEREHLQANYLVTKRREDAKVALVERILPTLHAGIHSRRLIADLVSRFYGKKGKTLTDKALRERYKLGRYKLDITKEVINDTLKAIADRAEMRAYYALQARGIIL